eukprot:jgi/Mesen1/3174/ME000184S02239
MLQECQFCAAPCDGSVLCGSCGAVFYCTKKHQLAHWKLQHRDTCERMATQMQRTDELFAFPFLFSEEATYQVDAGEVTVCSFLAARGLHGKGMWRALCSCSYEGGHRQPGLLEQGGGHLGLHVPAPHAPYLFRGSPPTAPLTSWQQYYTWRGLPLDSPVSLLLHTPSQHLPAGAPSMTVRIHVLGPERELDEVGALAELKELLPRGIHLQLHLIGPAVPLSRDSQVVRLCALKRCSGDQCECKGRSARSSSSGSSGSCGEEDKGGECGVAAATVTLVKGLYHDVFAGLCQREGRPDLVVAPNAGLAAFMDWLPSLVRARSPSGYHSCPFYPLFAVFAVSASASLPSIASSELLLFYTEGILHCNLVPVYLFPGVAGRLPGYAGVLSFTGDALLRKEAIPCVVTDFCEEAAVLAAQVMEAVYCRHLTLPVQVNPFRQPLSSKDGGMALPTLSNAFIFGMV